jgi:hypothetical protein
MGLGKNWEDTRRAATLRLAYLPGDEEMNLCTKSVASNYDWKTVDQRRDIRQAWARPLFDDLHGLRN